MNINNIAILLIVIVLATVIMASKGTVQTNADGKGGNEKKHTSKCYIMMIIM